MAGTNGNRLHQKTRARKRELEMASNGIRPASTRPSLSLDTDGLTMRLGAVIIKGIRPQVRWVADGIERTWAPTALVQSGPDTWVPAAAAPGGRRTPPFDMELQTEVVGGRDPRVVLTLTLRNTSEESVSLVSLSPLVTTHPRGLSLNGETETARWRRFSNGWQSWSNARSFGPDEAQRVSRLPFWRHQIPNPNHLADGIQGHLRSELVGAVTDPLRSSVVLGFIRADRQLCGLDIDLTPSGLERLEASCDLDGVTFSPAEEITSEPLMIVAGDDANVLLERWADELGSRQAARVPERPPSGWCSWYFYFTSVTGPDIEGNLAAIDRLGASSGSASRFDYVMVDDGHQFRIGDWLHTNSKFPRGMAEYARDIMATGRDAGIWIAPFVADPRSRLFKEHPDWFVRKTGSGRYLTPLWNPLWNRVRSMRVLDTTNPEALAHLEEVARTIRHDWGYRILKLDFLYCAALEGVRHDGDATLATTLRLGLEAIRRGAGEDAFLLGCGCPLGPAVGIVDGMRIGSDVAPYWDLRAQRLASRDEAGATTRVAIRNTLTRAFMHQRLWSNDPDCVMVRTDRTRLTDAEVRSLAVAVGLTDGMIVSSDRMETVPKDRLGLFDKVHELAGGSPRAVDLLDRSMPEVLMSEQMDCVLVGVFNFSDRPEQRVLDLTTLRASAGIDDLSDVESVEEVLFGESLSVRSGKIDFGVLAPHDVRVIRLEREASPSGGVVHR